MHRTHTPEFPAQILGYTIPALCTYTHAYTKTAGPTFQYGGRRQLALTISVQSDWTP